MPSSWQAGPMAGMSWAHLFSQLGSQELLESSHSCRESTACSSLGTGSVLQFQRVLSLTSVRKCFEMEMCFFPESALRNHRGGDFHPREYAACGLAGGLPGHACEERPSCGTDETSQTRSRGEQGLSKHPWAAASTGTALGERCHARISLSSSACSTRPELFGSVSKILCLMGPAAFVKIQSLMGVLSV